MNPDAYLNTLWMHTPKAVRRGEPGNRVFVVTMVQPVDDGSPNWRSKKWLHAWKCELLADGKLKHPAFCEPMDISDVRIFQSQSDNHSAPTAVFRPDSLYKQWVP